MSVPWAVEQPHFQMQISQLLDGSNFVFKFCTEIHGAQRMKLINFGEIFSHLLHGLAQCLIQTIMTTTWWILITTKRVLYVLHRLDCNNFDDQLILAQSFAQFHVSQRMNLHDFVNLLILRWAPPWGCSEWNVSTTIGCISMKFYTHTQHVLLSMNRPFYSVHFDILIFK